MSLISQNLFRVERATTRTSSIQSIPKWTPYSSLISLNGMDMMLNPMVATYRLDGLAFSLHATKMSMSGRNDIDPKDLQSQISAS